mmetsp:Transcript_22791/g.34842  ORF Transcript_22791/g.34842 Transcript_22791/m.34842 type:complete len:83 (+) Transcript_22791:683-931(+)
MTITATLSTCFKLWGNPMLAFDTWILKTYIFSTQRTTRVGGDWIHIIQQTLHGRDTVVSSSTTTPSTTNQWRFVYNKYIVFA